MLDLLLKGENIEKEMQRALYEIHTSGPTQPETFEKLAYFKKFHADEFLKYERKIIYAMGLFYKTEEPRSVLEEIYNIYSESIIDETGKSFTPAQASAYREIRENRYFSFSAPTSTGKSYLFRELIQDATGDIIIVVPSRALISEYYYEIIGLVDKSVLVLQFVEDINKENVNRRIYIITPERGAELFKYSNVFNVELVLLDEAQISEEYVRGMTFDSFVRRADRVFPNAKKVFAHPFIENPEAQLLKHGFSTKSAYKNYNFHSVGKMFLSVKNGKFEYFSPNIDCDSVPTNSDIAMESLSGSGSLLVYMSKGKIYDGRFLVEFDKYIKLCNKVKNKKAVKLIETLRLFIGAARGDSDKRSVLINMMEIGIVVHHGSMPLRARLIIEEFVKNGFAKICFATSTLSQGINMPFDVVWIDNFHKMNALVLKNLIGRSGRTTRIKNQIDYGHTIVKKQNVSTFSRRFKDTVKLTENSPLDDEVGDIDEDLRDIVEAIRDDKYNEKLHLTESQVSRIETANIDSDINYVLDNLLMDSTPITGKDYYNLSNTIRTKIKSSLKKMYVQHLRRKKLTKAEACVLSASIPILLWHIQGKSFSEIVSLRHAFLSEKDKRRSLLSRVKRGDISAEEAKEQSSKIQVRFTPIPSHLPNKDLKLAPLYTKGTPANEIDYDTIVYDTYDYLDKVISLSLVDPLCASLDLYMLKSNDSRAGALKNYIKFGTNSDLDIWLMKYGFGFEEIDWIQEHIDSIDEFKIVFKKSIHSISEDRKRMVERYI